MMRGPKLAAMAWRNLWRRRRRTFLTLVSIAFGGFLAVMFTAIQDRSFSDFIDTAARLAGGHVTLQHPEALDRPSLGRTVRDVESLRAAALDLPGVERAVPRIGGEILLATARDSYGAFFLAYDPALEDETTFSFVEGLVAGEAFDGPRDRGIVLGQRLAHNLGLELGDKVVYTLTDREGGITTGMERLKGILDTGSPSLDGGLCLLAIDALRPTLAYAPGESTQVAIFLGDSRRSAAVARRLQAELAPERSGAPRSGVAGSDVSVAALTWEETQAQLASFIAMKIGGGRVMEAIILALVAAGIFNTLFVSVMERLREFGIMMAIGFSPGQLFRSVMWESLWLAVLGLGLGAAVTVGPYAWLAREGLDFSALVGGNPTEVAGVGFEMVLRVGIYPEHLFFIVVAIVLATLLAGLYPAWRAGRVVPVESIKLV